MLRLNDVQKCLISLISCSLGKESKIENQCCDWHAVVKEAYAQSVQLMVMDAIDKLSKMGSIVIDPVSLSEIEQLKTKSIVANMKTSYAILETDRLMRGHNFPYMILKGFAAAGYYPDPSKRMLGDVDFLIDYRQQSDVEKVLEDNGYRRKSKVEHAFHVAYHKPDQDLEMHFDIAGVPDGELGVAVRNYMDGALFDTVTSELSGKEISIPKHKYHGLILILHMQRHMLRSGLGLRHLLDLAVFVDKTYEEVFWEEDLIPLLREIGLFVYTKTMIKTASIYFDTICPEWAEDADEELCDLVMNDILSSGNFGRKDDTRSKAGMMITASADEGTGFGKVHNLYYTLHNSSASHWPFVRKHRIIWFMADCFRAVKYLYRWSTGSRPSLIKANSYADERKNVYDRLKVFEKKYER